MEDNLAQPDTMQDTRLPWEKDLPPVAANQPRDAETRSRKATWPPCLPILTHDIEHDLQKSLAKPIARRSYFYWQRSIFFLHLVTIIGLILNACSSIVMGTGMISATLLLFFYPFLSFISWHWILYTALRLESFFFFTLWIVFFLIHLALEFVLLIGYNPLRYILRIYLSGGIRMFYSQYEFWNTSERTLHVSTLIFAALLIVLGFIHMRSVWVFITRAMHAPDDHP